MDFARVGQLCRNVDLSPRGLVGDRVIVFVRALSSGKRAQRVGKGGQRPCRLDAVALLVGAPLRARTRRSRDRLPELAAVGVADGNGERVGGVVGSWDLG